MYRNIPHLIFLLALLFGQPLFANRCADIFRAAEIGALRGNEDTVNLDHKLTLWIQKQLADQPTDKQGRILEILKSSKTDPYMESENGVAIAEGKTIDLQLRQSIVDHPLARIVIAHELGHLKRGDYGKLATWKLNGVRRNERLAFGDEYDFIHFAFEKSDMAAIKKNYPTRGSREINEVNVEFIDLLEDAFSMTKEQYIANSVASYKEANLIHNLRLTTLVGTGTLSVYTLINWISAFFF